MKKEIGSIFPIYWNSHSLSDKCCCHNLPLNKSFFSLCREALYEIARINCGPNSTVLIPAYTCNTVISPFKSVGWKCHYYSIKKNLRIDISSIKELICRFNPSIVVVHPYFGMDLDSKEINFFKDLEKNKIKVVVDLTQCIYSVTDYSFASYIVGSYRKWFPIPDGGFLKCKSGSIGIDHPKDENISFLNEIVDAMYLRGVYFRLRDESIKDVSIRLCKKAEQIADNIIIPHRMSDMSHNILNELDLSCCSKNRIENYQYLYNKIEDCNSIYKVLETYECLTTAPIYFPLYVNNRDQTQRALALESIYAPILWPIVDKGVLINDDVKFIYNHILAIPCDQRYTCEDMDRVARVINELSKY